MEGICQDVTAIKFIFLLSFLMCVQTAARDRMKRNEKGEHFEEPSAYVDEKDR
jgi:hypothetical protein